MNWRGTKKWIMTPTRKGTIMNSNHVRALLFILWKDNNYVKAKNHHTAQPPLSQLYQANILEESPSISLCALES